MCNQCYPPDEREQREIVEGLRDYIQALPAAIYNARADFWQGRLAEEEKILDDMIDARYADKRSVQ